MLASEVSKLARIELNNARAAPVSCGGKGDFTVLAMCFDPGRTSARSAADFDGHRYGFEADDGFCVFILLGGRADDLRRDRRRLSADRTDKATGLAVDADAVAQRIDIRRAAAQAGGAGRNSCVA